MDLLSIVISLIFGAAVAYAIARWQLSVERKRSEEALKRQKEELEEALKQERKRSEEIVKERLWTQIKSREYLAGLVDFSEDSGFTLTLISYLIWAKQIIGFTTPAPDALPSFRDSHMFKRETRGADATIPVFWQDKLENLGIIQEGGGEVIWRSVKEKIEKAESSVRDRDVIKNLSKVGWVNPNDGKGHFEPNKFLEEFPKHLENEDVRNCLLHVMNTNKKDRKPEEDEVLGDLILYLYRGKYEEGKYLKKLFDQACSPWSATLDDLVRFTKVPLEIVTSDSMQTIKRIIDDEQVFLLSTGGGAWLLDYTVNYLCKEHREKLLLYSPLIGQEKLLDEPDTNEGYSDFWNKLNKIDDTGALRCFFEHPFQDRVLGEIARGENLRYAAEMLANRKALLEKYKNEGGIQVIWYREPFFYVGHMQHFDVQERGKDKFDFYYQIYQSFGRTRLNSRAIALGSPPWEDKGIVYRILGEKAFRFGDTEEAIIENVKPAPDMDTHKGEITLRYISNLQMDAVEALRRQLTIHSLLENCKKGDFDAASEDFLRLPWLPYHELGVGFTRLNETEGMDFADPITWKGNGLLELFRHESELSYKILASIKILSESFSRADKETRLPQEKNPHLAASEDLIKDYLCEYCQEMNSLCEFIKYATAKFNFGNEVKEQFEKTIPKIKGNLDKLKVVNQKDINELGFATAFNVVKGP